MNLSIIGVSATDGLGNHLATSLSEEYVVRTFKRGESWDLNDDVIILNFFDYRFPALQEKLFVQMFSQLRDTEKQLVVVGSTAHHFDTNGYADAKRALNKTFYDLCKHTDTYRCKVILLEPGLLEKVHGKPASWAYLKYSEVASLLKLLLKTNPKFLHTAVRGDHAPTID